MYRKVQKAVTLYVFRAMNVPTEFIFLMIMVSSSMQSHDTRIVHDMNIKATHRNVTY